MCIRDRRNSSHEEKDRWRSREREDPRYNPHRQGNSLDDPERNTNRDQPSNPRTERQATTQGLPTNTPVRPNRDNNANENWVTVIEHPSHSIPHNEPNNDGGPRIAQVNHVNAEYSQKPKKNPSQKKENDYSKGNIDKYGSDKERVEYLMRW